MEHSTVRRKMIERYAAIRNRLEKVSRDGRHAEGLVADFEEQAVERQNDDVLANLDVAIRAEMAHIEKTLARLDSGEYGICDVCSKKIPPKRLEALPYATRCLACEKR
jgi:DnaK suppressor protein